MAHALRKLALTLSLCAVTATGCEEQDGGVPDEQRRISGIVTDGVSGRALGGVAIRFTSDTLDKASDKTNGDGEYEFSVSTDAANGRIEAKKDGYVTRLVSVHFDDDDVQVDIQLTPGQDSRP